MERSPKSAGGSCEFCAHYEYDDEMDCFTCEMNLDEDIIKDADGSAIVDKNGFVIVR